MTVRRTAILAMTLGLFGLSVPALAEQATTTAMIGGAAVIAPLTAEEAARYRDILDMLKAKKWSDAKSAILALDEADSMRPWLRAELYLAKDSPRVELFDVMDLLNKAPFLPQADQLSRLAAKRGATALPSMPQVRELMWTGGSPQRSILKAVSGDAVADSLRAQLLDRIKNDDPAGGEALLAVAESDLTAEGRTELRQRLAWSYYIGGQTADARRMAKSAVKDGSGTFVSPAWWVQGLAAWRDKDWNGAAQAFYQSAMSAPDADMRSGGYFWAARATMADRHPEKVGPLLLAAARDDETFYGLLARETLGLGVNSALMRDHVSRQDWDQLKNRPNARNAVILTALGRIAEADDVLKREAALSGEDSYSALVHLASDLSLPTTQLWLAQRSPDGRKVAAYSRFPMPRWTPANGWQVDKALVFAHALQESRFQVRARSTADARGILQVRPGTGSELAAEAGMGFTSDQLYDPDINIALAQLYMKKLASMPATGGLLPKVVAAYNAGPVPVERWNVQVRDEGDPLLFIESVPYYETRAYLNAVLRNYWIYQMEEQGNSPALSAMAQGLWTRFPDGKKTVAVRMTAVGSDVGAY